MDIYLLEKLSLAVFPVVMPFAFPPAGDERLVLRGALTTCFLAAGLQCGGCGLRAWTPAAHQLPDDHRATPHTALSLHRSTLHGPPGAGFVLTPNSRRGQLHVRSASLVVLLLLRPPKSPACVSQVLPWVLGEAAPEPIPPAFPHGDPELFSLL